MSRSRRLVAVGYQGFGNLGDEAILTGIEAILVDARVTVAAVVCGPEPASVVGFPSAARIVSARLLPTPAALRALWASDGLLLSGGGLIHDHWPTVIPRYLAWIALARALGKRVVWVGVGVGPIRSRSLRGLAWLARRLTNMAIVRDPSSADLLGGVGERLVVAPDPAVFNARPIRSASAPGAGELAIVIRGPTPGHRDRADTTASALVDTCEAARRRGLRPVVLTMAGRADAEFAALVRDRARARGETIPIAPLGSTPAAAMQRLASCRAVISIRLHGMILAALAGVPCVPVAYDAKVRAAATQLGIEDLVVEQGAMTADSLLERVAEASLPQRVERVEACLEALRGQRRRVAGRIASAWEQDR